MTGAESAWMSLGRLHFRIPPGWEGPSEISYRVVSPNKQHLTWSPADFGEDEVSSWLEERRRELSDAFGALAVGPVSDVENPYWAVSGFIAEFTGDQAPIALGTHVVQRPGAPLVLHSRLQGPDRGALSRVLFSVAPWVQGVPLAHDNDFFVLGCTFTSPLALLEPRTTHADSWDLSLCLDVTWRDDAPQFSEPDWRRLCPSEQSAVLRSRDSAWIESGAKRPAIAGTEGLRFESVQATATAHLGGELQELTWCQARAPFEEGHVWLELKGAGGSADALAAWRSVFDTLYVERRNRHHG